MLANKTEDADGSVCARYCTPVNSFEGASGSVTGAEGHCSSLSLAQSGGSTGNHGPHQCRFVQSFYSNTEDMPAGLGMCVPVEPLQGGSWGDCSLLDWDGIRDNWNSALEAHVDPVQSFESYCLVAPADPTSDVLERCQGLFRGCLSLEEIHESLPMPNGASFWSVGSPIPWMQRQRRFLDELVQKPSLPRDMLAW
jgi:hypothetical protein